MKFKLWLENAENKPNIFLDLDETLVKTTFVPTSMLEDKELVEKINHLGGKIGSDFVTFLRPHAKEFIKELKSFANVFILTNGKRKFQKNIIKLLEIPIKEKNIFGREDYDGSSNKLPQSENSILIDDLSLNTSGVQSKLNAMGINPKYDDEKFEYEPVKNHIKIKIFDLNPFDIIKNSNNKKENFNDKELINILPKIKEMVKK